MPVSYSPELDHGNDVPTGPPFMLQEVVFEFEFSNFVRIILWFRRLYIRDSYYTNGFQPCPTRSQRNICTGYNHRIRIPNAHRTHLSTHGNAHI